jgi:hypothetical protein
MRTVITSFLVVLALASCTKTEIPIAGTYSRVDGAGNYVTIYLHTTGSYDLRAVGPMFSYHDGEASGAWSKSGDVVLLQVKKAEGTVVRSSRVFRVVRVKDAFILVPDDGSGASSERPETVFMRIGDDMNPDQVRSS